MQAPQTYFVAHNGDVTTIKGDHSTSHQPLVDLRSLPVWQRKNLLLGPQITIQELGVVVARFPLNLLLATSPKMQEHINKCPGLDKIDILSSKEPGYVRLVLDWLRLNTQRETFIPLPEAGVVEVDLKMCRAARQLGLDDIYVRHLVEKFSALSPSGDPNWRLVTLAEEAALDREDPVLKTVCSQLCRARFKGLLSVQSSSALERYLQGHPRVREIMEAIDEEHANNRKARKEDPRKWHGKLKKKADGAGVLSEDEVAHILGRT